jgi:radical SAM protein with 4Fe4S-binding SPASM domain
MPEQTYFSKDKGAFAGQWQRRPLQLPHLDIELTERCNNDCIHCSIRQPEHSALAKESELSAEEITIILAQAAAIDTLSVRFTGGEPLIRSDFEEIYLAARKLGLKVLLFTNARLITRRIAELFKSIPPLERIEVTVYGMTEKSYESVTRTKGSYREFTNGVNLLLEYNIPFIVKGALLPAARHELSELEEWAGTIPWMEGPPSLSMLFNLRDRRDSPDRNALIEKLRLSPEDYISAMHRHRHVYRNETIKFCSRFIGPPGDMLFSCGGGHKVCVDAYGNAQMCLPLRCPDTTYPLKEGSLPDALKILSAKSLELKATNSEYLRRCALCFLKGLCEQCPAKSWSEHGTLDTPVEYLCDIAHALARDLGLLEAREKGWQVGDWKERVAKAATNLL